jgi:hypothetical protein
VARRSDLEYPITPEWRESVKSALGNERGAQARLAEEIGCSPGTLADLLSTGKRSHLVPRIHKALGWDPPMPPLMSTDTHEIVVFLKKMGEPGRQVLKQLQTLDRDQLKAAMAVIDQLAKNKDRS